MATTIAQQQAVAIAPKFTAAASAISSSIMIFLILGRGKEKNTYHRLVLGMSLSDLLASIAWFFTTWPIPRGTPDVFGAVGNQQTCSAQAFFTQFSLSTVMYNASLAIYYVLVIVKGWIDRDIARVEALLHVNAISWGLGTTMTSLGLTLFNPVGWDCWIGAAPLGCQESWNSPDGTTTCERGDNASLYQWAFYFAPICSVILLVTGLMYWVYSYVATLERKMKRYTHHITGGEQSTLSQQKRVAGQAAAYVGSFFMTWLFPAIFQLVNIITGNFPFPLLLLKAISIPIQGLFNLFVFIRPSYVQYRECNPDEFFICAWFSNLKQQIVRWGPRRIAEI